jgi:predicted RNA binding protein YcfA (HicA-like mRNA interferase family)
MPNRHISFGVLRQFLIDLGFVETRWRDSQVVFEHPPSGTMFVFPLFRPQDQVPDYHLISVRKQLDERGVLERTEFEGFLHKVTA